MTEINDRRAHDAQGDLQWSGKSLLQLIDDLNAEIPEEVLSQARPDGAEEHDHYIYGTPKKSAKPRHEDSFRGCILLDSPH